MPCFSSDPYNATLSTAVGFPGTMLHLEGSRCGLSDLQVQQQIVKVCLHVQKCSGGSSGCTVVARWDQHTLIYAISSPETTSLLPIEVEGFPVILIVPDCIKRIWNAHLVGFTRSSRSFVSRMSLPSCFIVESFNNMAVEAQVFRDGASWEI